MFVVSVIGEPPSSGRTRGPWTRDHTHGERMAKPPARWWPPPERWLSVQRTVLDRDR